MNVRHVDRVNTFILKVDETAVKENALMKTLQTRWLSIPIEVWAMRANRGHVVEFVVSVMSILGACLNGAWLFWKRHWSSMKVQVSSVSLKTVILCR